jgi:hypothetical protein
MTKEARAYTIIMQHLSIEHENTREFAPAFSRDGSKSPEWRQIGSFKFLARPLKLLWSG